MAHSRLAAIARRSYFDPDEDDGAADNENVELFVANKKGASGKAGHLNSDDSDTLFQQVRLGGAGGVGPAASSDQDKFSQGSRSRTAVEAAAAAGGGEGGGRTSAEQLKPDQDDANLQSAISTCVSQATTRGEDNVSKGHVPLSIQRTEIAAPVVIEAAGGSHHSEIKSRERPGTREGRRVPNPTTMSCGDGVYNAEAVADRKDIGSNDRGSMTDTPVVGLQAALRPSSSQQERFTMDDFTERPLSRAGGSASRRISQYREPQAGDQQPLLAASGSSKQGMREGIEDPTGRPKTRGEGRGPRRSAAEASAGRPTEDPAMSSRPRTAGRRHHELQDQHDGQGSSTLLQVSQASGASVSGEIGGTGTEAKGSGSDAQMPLPDVSPSSASTLLVTEEIRSGKSTVPVSEVMSSKAVVGTRDEEPATPGAARRGEAARSEGKAEAQQQSAAIARQRPSSTVPGGADGAASGAGANHSATADVRGAERGQTQSQSSTISSMQQAPSQGQSLARAASAVATKAEAEKDVLTPTRLIEGLVKQEPHAHRASADVTASIKGVSSLVSEQPGGHSRPPSIQTTLEDKPSKSRGPAFATKVAGQAEAKAGDALSAKHGEGERSVTGDDTGDRLDSEAIFITTAKSPILGQSKGHTVRTDSAVQSGDQSTSSAAAVEASDAYALVPRDAEGGSRYQHQEPNFVLVGEPHSQFDATALPEGEAVDDYELIGREPMITVTSQKSLFELLQRQTEAEAATQRRLLEEEQLLQQQELDRQQQFEEQAYADANKGAWDDGLHFGTGASQDDGKEGSQQQWPQSSEGGGEACADCRHHQEDIPPAHYAAAVGHFACLQALCTQDAYSLMSFDGANRSTLFYASASERTDCCEFLIDWYSPLINLADTNGDTPLHAAASSGSEACLYLLLHKGQALMETQNRMGMTPAHLAKNASILRSLFEAGAQMAAQDRHGRTPLYLASAMNRTECAAYLCEIADLDQLALADRRGDTPLHAAAFHGNQECLLLLLQFGAPPTTPNCKGLTAIDLAHKKGHTQCLKVLQEYHLHHSTNFDSVLFLATVEGHKKHQQEGEASQTQEAEHQALLSKKSICLKHYKEWLAYEYDDGRTFWYNSRTGHSQWEQPPELVMSPTAHRLLLSKDPSTVTKLKEVGDWIKYSNAKTRSFYYNQQSGDFQWTQPPEFGYLSSTSTATGDGAQEVCGWQVYRDPLTGKTFYYNPATQVSSWEPPPEGEVGGAWVPEQEEEAREVNELSDLGV